MASSRAVLWFPPPKDPSASEASTNALSSLGSPSPQHVPIRVLHAAVSTTTSPRGTGCLWPFLPRHPARRLRCCSPARTSGIASLAPAPLCSSLCPLPSWFWPLEARFLSSLSFTVCLAAGRQARTSHNRTHTHKLPEFVSPSRFPPSSCPRCFFSKRPGSRPLPPTPPRTRSPLPALCALAPTLPVSPLGRWQPGGASPLPGLPVTAALDLPLQPRAEKPGWLTLTQPAWRQTAACLGQARTSKPTNSNQTLLSLCELGFFSDAYRLAKLGAFFFPFATWSNRRYSPEKMANPPPSRAKPLLLNMGTAGSSPRQQEQLLTCGEN